MNRATFVTGWIAIAALAAAIGGCAHSKPARVITIQGALTQGAECPIVITSDGHRYSVTGSLGTFHMGDRVCIRGTVIEASICMAGEATVSIEAIGAENDCP